MTTQTPYATEGAAPPPPRYFYEDPVAGFLPVPPDVCLAPVPAGSAVTKRPTVAAAEELLGVQHLVLESSVQASTPGLWALVDYMGNDGAVIDSARTSINFGVDVQLVRTDAGLLMYLMEHAHTSPFERVELVFLLKLPLFVFAQLVRHRTASLNSASARYAVMRDEFWIPGPTDWRRQGGGNKQATSEAAGADHAAAATELVMQQVAAGYSAYDWMLGPIMNPDAPEREQVRDGVGRELARIVLPQNLMTTVVWKVDLHNLLHFIGLRDHAHAQHEVRVYAKGFAQAVQAVAPLCWAAFVEHRRDGLKLSATEAQGVSLIWETFKAELGEEAAIAAVRRAIGGRATKLVGKLEGIRHG